MIMKANKKHVIESFLHSDMKKLEYHVSKVLGNLYSHGVRYHRENYGEDVEEIERLINYWQHVTKNLNK